MTSTLTSRSTGHAVHGCDVRVGPDDVTSPPRRFPTWARVTLGVPTMLLASSSVALPRVVPGFDTWVSGLEGPALAAVLIALSSPPALVAVVLVRALMRFVDRRPARQAGLRFNSRSLPAFVLALGLTVALLLLTGTGLAALTELRPMATPGVESGRPTWIVVVGGLAAAFLMQGIPEEIIWRGYVVQTLRTGPAVSVHTCAAVFAVCHLISQGGQQNAWERIVYLAVPYGLGVLAGALVVRTGSLWAAFGVHGGVHTATMIGTLWLGLGGGPILWATYGVVMTAVGMLVMRDRSATGHSTRATG